MKRYVGLSLALLLILLLCGFLVLRASRGFSARHKPSSIEAAVAKRLRLLAIPREARTARNPVSPTRDALAEARAHFADHCAVCHANNGGGDTPIGRSLYPPAPDMRRSETQSLSDGELFYIIHNGIRFTGMPAWGSDNADEDLASWGLVHFIRHLPELSDDEIREMQQLNPKSRHELGEKDAIRRFLAGEDAAPPATGEHEHR